VSPSFKGGVGDEIIVNPIFSLGVSQLQITLLAACIESGGLVVPFLFPGSYNADTFKSYNADTFKTRKLLTKKGAKLLFLPSLVCHKAIYWKTLPNC